MIPQDSRLREAMNALQEGLNAADLKAEEAAWTRIIDEYSGVDAPWVQDVVGGEALMCKRCRQILKQLSISIYIY